MSHHRAAPPSIHEERTLGKAYDARLLRRLWEYVRPHRALVLLSMLLVLGVGAAQLVQPYLIKLAIDDHIATSRLEGLGRLALLFLAALMGEFLLRFLQLYVLQRTGQNVIFGLRTRLFAHLQRLPSSFFDRWVFAESDPGHSAQQLGFHLVMGGGAAGFDVVQAVFNLLFDIELVHEVVPGRLIGQVVDDLAGGFLDR